MAPIDLETRGPPPHTVAAVPFIMEGDLAAYTHITSHHIQPTGTPSASNGPVKAPPSKHKKTSRSLKSIALSSSSSSPSSLI